MKILTRPEIEAILPTLDLLPRIEAAFATYSAGGADTPHKQELDAAIIGMADQMVVDSLSQCAERGELAHAHRAGLMGTAQVVELGAIISEDAPKRTDPQAITVADLTGVAVQDIAIASAVFEASQS